MLEFEFNHHRPQDNPTRNWVGRYQAAGDEIKIVWMNQFADPANPERIRWQMLFEEGYRARLSQGR
jgi:hypothetical protein